MVDALIVKGEEQIPLEITSVRNPAALQQVDALARLGRETFIPGLQHSYIVVLDPKAHLKTVRAHAGPFLAAMEAANGPGRSPELSEAAAEPGITVIRPLEQPECPAGTVMLLCLHGTAQPGEDPLSALVTAHLHAPDTEDVRSKLGKYPGDERHVFIWSCATAKGVHHVMAHPMPLTMPQGDPVPPPEITHVWVAGTGRTAAC